MLAHTLRPDPAPSGIVHVISVLGLLTEQAVARNLCGSASVPKRTSTDGLNSPLAKPKLRPVSTSLPPPRVSKGMSPETPSILRSFTSVSVTGTDVRVSSRSPRGRVSVVSLARMVMSKLQASS